MAGGNGGDAGLGVTSPLGLTKWGFNKCQRGSDRPEEAREYSE